MLVTPELVTTMFPVVAVVDIPVPTFSDVTPCEAPSTVTVTPPVDVDVTTTPAPVKFKS